MAQGNQGRSSTDNVAKTTFSQALNLIGALILDGASGSLAYLALTGFSLIPHAARQQIFTQGALIALVGLALMFAYVILSVGPLVVVVRHNSRLNTAIRTAPQVVAKSVDIAPLASTQPVALPRENLTPGATTFVPLRDPAHRIGRMLVIVGALQVLLAFLGSGFAIIVLIPLLASLLEANASALASGPTLVKWFVDFLTVFMLALGVIWVGLGLRSILRGGRVQRTYWLVADDQTIGLSNREPGAPDKAGAVPAHAAMQTRYLAGALLGVLALASFASLAAAFPIAWVAGAVGAIVAVLVIGAVVQARARSSQGTPETPNTGIWRLLRAALSPTPQPDPAPIAWGDFRAFFLLDHWRGVGGTGHAYYSLHTGERMLFWGISSNAPDAVLAGHEMLCRLIVTRTGLPLRDVSAIAGKSL